MDAMNKDQTTESRFSQLQSGLLRHVNEYNSLEVERQPESDQESWAQTFNQLMKGLSDLYHESFPGDLSTEYNEEALWERFSIAQSDTRSGTQVNSPEAPSEIENTALASLQEVAQQEADRQADARTPSPLPITVYAGLPTPSLFQKPKRKPEQAIEHFSSPSKRPRPAAATPERVDTTSVRSLLQQATLQDNDLRSEENNSGNQQVKGKANRNVIVAKASSQTRPLRECRKALPASASSSSAFSRVPTRVLASGKNKHQNLRTVSSSSDIESDTSMQLPSFDHTKPCTKHLATSNWLSCNDARKLAYGSDRFVCLALLMRSESVAAQVPALMAAVLGERQRHPYIDIANVIDGERGSVEQAEEVGIQLLRAIGLQTCPNLVSIIKRVSISEACALVQIGERLSPRHLTRIAKAFRTDRKLVGDYRKVGDCVYKLLRYHIGLIVFLGLATYAKEDEGPLSQPAPLGAVKSFESDANGGRLQEIIDTEWARRACFQGQRILSCFFQDLPAVLEWSIAADIHNLSSGKSCTCEQGSRPTLFDIIGGTAGTYV